MKNNDDIGYFKGTNQERQACFNKQFRKKIKATNEDRKKTWKSHCRLILDQIQQPGHLQLRK